MEAIRLKECIKKFKLKLKDECSLKLLNTNERIALYDKVLLEVKSEEPEEVQPYLRATLIYNFIDKVDSIYLSTNKIDYKEIAHYFKAVIDDIVYVAANDICDYSSYHYIYCVKPNPFLARLVTAIIIYCSKEDLKRFLHSVVNIKNNENNFFIITQYFMSIITQYTSIKDYNSAIEYGEWYFEFYETKEDTLDELMLYDLEYSVDTIHKSLESAYKALKIKNEKNESAMVGVREREAEPYRAKLGRKRKALYSLADECKGRGDMDGYYGYLSAAGDVGR